MATIDELGLTPYQRIMARMTPTMNPYTGADVAVGGYDPALYRRMSGSGLINLGVGGGMGGGGGGGGDYTPTPSDWDNMTNSQKAAFYAENPNMASVTRGLQTLFGNTLLGRAQNYFNPGFVSEQRLLTSVDPVAYQNAKESFRASEIAAMNAGYPSPIDQNAQAMQSMQDAYNADMAAASNYGVGYNSPTADGGIGGSPADADSGAGGYSGSVGADYGGSADGGIGGSPADADSGAGGYGNNDSSYGGCYNMGGPVDRVGGPNPPGPDDGAGMLQLGEYVIKKSAVNKYGQGLLDMINDGKIPAKKMKSLLG